MITASALDDLRARNPVPDIAGRWVSLRRGSRAGRFIGPCPLHSKDPHAKDSTSFECWADGWVCATCQDGGDVIRLVELYERLDFRAAVQWLGGAQEVDPAEEARRAREQAEAKARAARDDNAFRERERADLWSRWSEAKPWPGTPVDDYLRLRRLVAPPGALLRAHPALPYVVAAPDAQSRPGWRRLHSGPAMLAAILGPDGRFAGLHISWIDLAQPKGKLAPTYSDTGWRQSR
ncbi:DUF7146 domain-containing protein [Ancylobacter mangrovi]|uniref:DUF7146 domain-containing protein n=1 Tax=Ancylobacter mangrovi TaxID=2972472 RepID=UPI002162DE0B|nr:CHC2 zinc finger domain-containing protein [Ancylobacter mangrovi]MCS0503611.1 CHC2 zinc finger domain-containing protein [Ancylobacter mangrovi]